MNDFMQSVAKQGTLEVADEFIRAANLAGAAVNAVFRFLVALLMWALLVPVFGLNVLYVKLCSFQADREWAR